MWTFSSRLLLDDHLWIPPSGFWPLKEITFVPNISYQGAQLSASTYLSLYFFPIYSIHFHSFPCFSLCLISSPRSISYPPHIFTMRHLWTEHIWLLPFTHAGVIVFLPSAIWKMSYINRLPLHGNHRSCANVYVCLSKWITSVLAADEPTSVPLHNASALSLQFNISLQISASFIYINCFLSPVLFLIVCVCAHGFIFHPQGWKSLGKIFPHKGFMIWSMKLYIHTFLLPQYPSISSALFSF